MCVYMCVCVDVYTCVLLCTVCMCVCAYVCIVRCSVTVVYNTLLTLANVQTFRSKTVVSGPGDYSRLPTCYCEF